MPEPTKLEIVRAALKSIEGEIVLLEPVIKFDLFNEKYSFPIYNVDFFVAPKGEMLTEPKQLNGFLDSLAIKDLNPSSSSHFDWIGAETLQLGFHQYNEIIGNYKRFEEIIVETHDKETEQRLKESKEPVKTLNSLLLTFKEIKGGKGVLTRTITVRPNPNKKIAEMRRASSESNLNLSHYIGGFPHQYRPPDTSQ